MKAFVKKPKSLICMLLIVCMLAALIVAMCISVTAETVLPETGIGFDADDDLALTKRLDKQPKTYEAVIYAPTTVSRTGVIFGNYYDSNASCINFEIHNDGQPSLFLRDASKNTMSTKFENVDVRKDDWVHLVVTHEITDNGAVFNCYVNGVLADTITTDLKYEINMGTLQFTHLLALGRDSRSGNTQYFKGKIKTLALYSEALTADEIKSSYDNGVNAENTALMAHYKLENANGAESVEDATVNGHNLAPRFSPSTGVEEYDYSFAILGDTQKHIYRDTYLGTNYSDYIYDWIVANKASRKINVVIGLGDITDKDGKDNTADDGVNQTNLEWQLAVAQHKKLTDAGIPYSIIQGNHDSVAKLDTYFAGNDNFKNADVGYYSGNSLGNYYMRFTAGDEKYMVLGLQYGPTDDIIAWAGNVIKANPDHKVIITTHAYLKTDAATIDMFYSGTLKRKATTASSTAHNGNQIWSDLASQHENVIMVLSGHVPCADIKVRQDMGVNGNVVTQFLIDPQGMDPIHDYKTGMVAMFYFSNGGKTIQVEYVSTYRSLVNGDGKDYIYNADTNKFTFTVPEKVTPTDVECDYGTIAGRYSNPVTYPFVVFKTDKTFIGGYTELSDAVNAIQALGGADDYVIYMRKNAELRDATANLAGFKGTVTVDLGGNKLVKAYDGSIFSVYVDDNSAAKLENGFDVGGRFVIKNGTVLKYGPNPIVALNYGTNFANSYKVFFEFNNVTFVDNNGGDYNIFASLEDGNANGGTACMYPFATFTDCTFDYTTEKVPPTMINLANKDGYNRIVWDLKVNGGKIVASAVVKYNGFVGADKGTEGREDKVLFGTGTNGKYLVLELPSSATAPTLANLWESGDGYMGFGSATTENGVSTYELKTVEGYVTKYGVVPEEYLDATKYPILMFKDGTFIEGYPKFISESGGAAGKDAFYQAKCLVDGNNDGEVGATVQLLFRADVEVTSYYSNAGQCQGTIIVDLDGHKLIQKFSNYPLVYLLAKQWKSYGIGDATFKFLNGELVLTTDLIYFGSNDGGYDGAATADKYKTMYVEFKGIKFSYSEGSTATAFLGRHYDGSNMSDGRKIGYNVNFTDCTFDLTNAASITTVINAKDNAVTRCSNIVNVTVKGCEMITKNPSATLYEIHESNGSSVVFDKNDNGKYLKMTVVGSDAAPTATPNNGDLYFKQGADDKDGNKTYELSLVGMDTKYGFVPKAYLDATKYPILLFRDGELVGGYAEYITSSSGTKGVDALYIAKCFIDGNNVGEVGSSVQMLFQADVEAKSNYSNLGQCQGTIIIDLNGHKLIQSFTDQPLFYSQAKEWDSYGIGDNTIEVCNGEIVLKDQLMFFGATGSAYNSEATDTKFKTFYFKFDGVKFSYAKEPTVAAFLGKFHDGSSISGGKKVGYEVTFNGCTFDFSNASSLTKILNAKDDAITKCDSIVNVTVNGCEMITKNLAATLYEVHESNGSSVVFAKGANDKYLKMTVVGTNEAPTGMANGNTLEFKSGSDDENGNKTYELTVHTHSYTIAKKDGTHHWGECSCGATDTKVEHNYNVPKKDDTHHWNECSCTAIDEKVEHSYTLTDKNSTQHWKKCATCGTVDATSYEGHKFENDSDNTCDCGYDRGHQHVYDTADHDEESHWNECSCGEKDASSVTAHKYDDNCDKTCVCGYERVAPHNYKTVYEQSDSQHWIICGSCGDEKTDSRAGHSYDDDCDTNCECGYTRTVTHDYTENGSDDDYHWKKCSVCGTPDNSTKAEHSFENDCDTDCECGFTRETEHDYDGECDTKCNVCGAPRTVSSDHTYDNDCDSECNVCGETRTVEHTYSNACDAECDVCDEVRTHAAHTGGSATCTAKAVCTVCGASYGEYADHVYGTEWKNGSTHHWHECSCGSKKDEAEHAFGEWSEKDGERTKSCACGYTVSDPDYNVDESLPTGAIVGIVVASVAGVGAIGFGAYYFVFKKKK